MKHFLNSIALFLLVFFLFDKSFYPLILLSQSHEVDKRLEMVIKGEVNKELIVMGASTGARDILAGQLNDSLGVSSYNLSYPGASINFQEFILRTLVKYNSKPKMIVLTVDPSVFLNSNLLNFRFDRLYPLVKYNYINNELIALGEKNVLSKFFVLSRINKSNFDIRRKEFTPLDTLLDCGSMPISFQRKDRKFMYTLSTDSLYDTQIEDTNKVLAFKEFQQLCMDKHIRLLVVSPPYFNEFDCSFKKRLESLLLPNVEYYAYDTTNPIYKDKSYFYDEKHLLTKGAKQFTNELIVYLQTNCK